MKWPRKILPAKDATIEECMNIICVCLVFIIICVIINIGCLLVGKGLGQ